MELKLTNILYNFNEFYRRCNIHLKLDNDVQEQLESLYEQYMDIVELSLDNSFEPEENVELSLEIIEFLLDNFRFFKNDIFDYSYEQTYAICPKLIVENYQEIYNHLVETYQLNNEGDLSMIGANTQEIEVNSNSNIYEDIINKLKFKHDFDDLYLTFDNIIIGNTYDKITKEELKEYINVLGFDAECNVIKMESVQTDFYYDVTIKNVTEYISFEQYDFEPGNIFTLKPEFKDGDEGEYFVIEDRGDNVLASPNWETGLSILPQEAIGKHMIAEVLPYNRVELPQEQVNEKLVKNKLKDFPFIKTYINLLAKSDKVKSEEKLIEEYKSNNSNETYTDYNEEFDLSVGDIITIRAGYNSDIAYTTKIWGFDSEGLAYVIWDCYWVPLELSERLLFTNKEI